MMTKRIAAFLLTMVVVSTLTACNTTEGFGRDVNAVGDGIQRAVE